MYYLQYHTFIDIVTWQVMQLVTIETVSDLTSAAPRGNQIGNLLGGVLVDILNRHYSG